jgi:hypothetical protein
MGSHCSGVWHFETDSLVLFVFYELVFFYAIGNVLLLLLLLLLLKRQCVPAFIRMWIAGVSCKLFSWRSVECGVLKEVIGKVVIFCMKCLSTILASYTLKNAMQMIHMLERLLGVSVCQQFCEIVKLFPCSEIMQLCWSSQYVCICILCIQMCKIPLILCCFFVRRLSPDSQRTSFVNLDSDILLAFMLCWALSAIICMEMGPLMRIMFLTMFL